MRVSVNKDDPGYRPRYFTSTVKVYLDSFEVKECITADEELGYVVVVARDESGELILDGMACLSGCHPQPPALARMIDDQNPTNSEMQRMRKNWRGVQTVLGRHVPEDMHGLLSLRG